MLHYIFLLCAIPFLIWKHRTRSVQKNTHSCPFPNVGEESTHFDILNMWIEFSFSSDNDKTCPLEQEVTVGCSFIGTVRQTLRVLEIKLSLQAN